MRLREEKDILEIQKETAVEKVPGGTPPEGMNSPEPDRKKGKRGRDRPAPREEDPGKKEKKGYIQDIIGFFLHLAILAAAIWAVFTFVFGVSIVYGESMYPRIRDGDVVVYYRMQRDIRTGDVLSVTKDGQTVIGRVIAAGGETVDISPEGQLLVNGSVSAEEVFYATHVITGANIPYPFEVPEDSFFILSDFRTNGYDSRNFGAVSRNEVNGKIITVMRRRGI